ncbi:uncharacterized protein TNCV_4421291 [Trichonephila clavipes]|nr:uncharacterized protein TNCV_4421291 [Trichonephila clavipes]
MEDPIYYELRVISIATGTSVYSPQSFPSFKASLELSISRIMHAHMLQRLFETSVHPNTGNFCLGLFIRRICRLSSIYEIWFGRRLARDPHPTASKDEIWVRIQAIWNYLPQADIQHLFDSMPRRIATLIAARGGYRKY